MPVNEKTQTAEEKQNAGSEQRQREADFAQKIIGELDLPAGLADAVDKKVDKKPVETHEEEAEDSAEEAQDESSEEEQEESEESSEEESAEDAGEEEASQEEDSKNPDPKNKTQKRIDELIRQNKLKDAKIKRLETQGKAPAAKEEASDPDQKILDKLASRPDAVDKLRALKRDTLAAWKTETDPKKAGDLLDLQEKIDATVASLPQRFANSQLTAYRDELATTIEAYGEDWNAKTGDAIFSLAKNIFAKSPILQRDVNGQAEALRQAVERFEENKKSTAGKDGNERLQRENNKLKKKVSLDVGAVKSNTDKSDNKRLFHKAKTGTNADKTAAVKKIFNTDSLIPEEYRK